MTARAAAFFDVDGTLLTGASIFGFLRHYLAVRDRPDHEYAGTRRRLKALADAGAPRSVALREYYQRYAGEPAELVAEQGRQWFAAELATGTAFHEPVLTRLREHAAAGLRIVLVSGSFPACLDPVAAHVGADLVLCTRPRIRRGLYTGATGPPVVGPAKVDVIRAAARDHDLDLSASYAYGDHVSDLPMLRLAGHPVVVAGDAPLRAHARRAGWSTVDPVPAGRPAPPVYSR